MIPVLPHMPLPPGGSSPPGPTLPVSLPLSLPRPLYPRVSSMMELRCEPPIHGRDDAGHSSTASSHHPAATTIAAPAANSCAIRWISRGGPATR
ncbi:Uncharacterised protein [Mycobacteroides abscessus subsp. abscessus]|nr:Uncharacterised protein [Mycobacteroides abscessus subsp. abscessus]